LIADRFRRSHDARGGCRAGPVAEGDASVNNIGIAAVIFACLFGAALAAMLIRQLLPSSHLDDQSKDAIKVGMGLIATMSALVLGLLIASAKTSYDTQGSEIRQIAANIGQLDGVLADYGEETREIRDLFRRNLQHLTDEVWQRGGARSVILGSAKTEAEIWAVHLKILQLTPRDEIHQALRTLAIQIATDLTRGRWHLVAEEGSAIPVPFLVILVFWLTVLFASFGLFAPWNTTVLATLFVGAVSVAAALFLILEMDRPFEGVLQISSGPIQKAIDRAAHP
jgi:hypothetical protein